MFSLAKRIEALGGACGVRDRRDGKQGSVFWFTFPYRPDEQDEPSVHLDFVPPALDQEGSGAPGTVPDAEEGPGPESTKKPTLPPLRILLTDDAASILKVTSRFLKAYGHTVGTAENGNQSLECLKKEFGLYDLLITDLQVQCSEVQCSAVLPSNLSRRGSGSGRVWYGLVRCGGSDI